MLEKMQWGQWGDALAGLSQADNMPRLLWALRLAILLLALLAGIYAVAHFVLLLGSDRAAGPAGDAASVVAGANPAAELDAETVKGWGWYSDRQAASVGNGAGAAPGANENVKKTRLQMRLEGIVKSDEEKESVAIIAINNQAKQYKTGARLPVAMLASSSVKNSPSKLTVSSLHSRETISSASPLRLPRPRVGVLVAT